MHPGVLMVIGLVGAVVSVVLASFIFPWNLILTAPSSLMVGWFGAAWLIGDA